MPKKNLEEIKRLCRVIANIKTPQDAELLIEDLCTIQEVLALSQRLEVASLLDSGKNYSEITEMTGVSSATISRVNRCLNYGSGGYKIALDIMKDVENDN
ncbi:MAG: TrpR-like protein YerC/YecD [Clostridia bacterium]|nr:TrpR-like protein YerC/YecD [Clostridia bacterium]